jgi:hypothetical protein
MHRVLLLYLALLLGPALVWAQTTPNSWITPQTPRLEKTRFVQGTDAAGTYKTLFTAAGGGARCHGISITSTDTAVAHVVTIEIFTGANPFGGTAVTVPVLAGFSSTVPPVAALTPTTWPGAPSDADGNSYITLVSGDSLQATYATALTAATRINVQAFCANY